MKIAIVLLLAIWLPGSAMVRMAVVIGNNIGLEDDKPLQFATRDAEQVNAAMEQLGGIDKGRGYLLLDPDVAKVMSTFEDARRTIVSLRNDGQKVQLLIYYSGHGSEEALHLNGEKLALSRIREFFREMEADLKILIADACFSGSLIQAKGAKLIDPVPVKYQDELKVNGSAILTSSSAGEFSQESKELQGSLFTHYFLTAIRGAGDADRDGMVSLWEAYNYTQAGLRRKLASVKNVSQNPEFDMDLRGSQNVVLTRVNMGQAFLAIRNVPEGRYRILESVSALQIAEISITDPEGTVLALPKGSYMVYRGSGQRGMAGYADLRKSRTVELGASDFAPVPLGALSAKGMAERERTVSNIRSGWHLGLAPRFYPAFPGRDVSSMAMDASLHRGLGEWAVSGAFAYLPAYVSEARYGRFRQEGLGFSAEGTRYWRTRFAGLFAGPRLEAWILEQTFDGKDLGRGNLLGTFAALGAERRLSGAMSLTASMAPGLFWSADVNRNLRRDLAVPFSLALGWGW
ncbi:MAG: peptidase caspase catalytic subunit p20 [Fibrobacteres bacterium]|nr:peptidase caspase catalytic subunit p20 [Fibrobacterota bacterium]